MDADGRFEAEELRINLGSLKRIDNAITDIVDKSAHVAFYKFDGSSWHKTNVEGSLFVFSRSHPPYYGFVIQNRRNMDNVCEMLIDGVEFQQASQFLLYKTQNSIHSIWFGEEAECVKIARILTQLMKTKTQHPLRSGRAEQPKPDRRNEPPKLAKVPSPEITSDREMRDSHRTSPQKKKGDILDIFHQAHKRYSCTSDTESQTKVTILKRDGEMKREEVKRQEGERSSPEDEPVRLSAGYVETTESKKAITFQELMNSVKSKSKHNSSRSSSPDQYSSKPSEPALYSGTVVQDLASSAHLLMSPLDFTKSPPLQKSQSPVKRTLFPTPARVSDPVESEADLEQFKSLLITAIQTDQGLVRQLYNAMLAQDKR